MLVVAGCYVGGEDSDAAKRHASASQDTTFVPVDAPTEPALPPNAGPYTGPDPQDKGDDPPPTSNPDSGTPPSQPDASQPPPSDGGKD